MCSQLGKLQCVLSDNHKARRRRADNNSPTRNNGSKYGLDLFMLSKSRPSPTEDVLAALNFSLPIKLKVDKQ